MKLSHSIAATAALVVALATAIADRADASAPTLVGSSTKVCQLTGDTDWTTNKPTAAQTFTNAGLDAVDLGFPVDSAPGPLYFLFGDAWPTKHPPGSLPAVPPDDAVGWTTRTTPPDPVACLDMHLVTNAADVFAHPTVVPAIRQGSFNVPTGGVYLNDFLYAFFWTDHCAHPSQLQPVPATPLAYPFPNPTSCLEIPVSNSVGVSVLARATPGDPALFHQTEFARPAILVLPNLSMPSGFVYVSAVRPPREPDGVLLRHVGVPVFGVPRYRASVPYLAMAPEATFGDPATWSFFAGMSGGDPVWITRAQWESKHNAAGEWIPPPMAQIYTPLLAGEQCVGEHSITYNAPLRQWLVLYNCGPWSIRARTAPAPWGPWSAPTVLLGLPHDNDAICTIIMSGAGCPNDTRRNYWPIKDDGTAMPGFFYAPFTLNRYTREASPPAGATHAATIYWLVSTWNPYEVIVMQSTIAE